jgi:hypothetical protein
MIAVLILGGCQPELPDDGSAPVTSAASARHFVEKALAAGQLAAETGRFELTVTEGEVTSFLNIGVLLLRQSQRLPLEDLDQIQNVPGLEGVDIGQWQELLGQRERLPGGDRRRFRLRLTVHDALVRFRSNGHMVVRGDVRLLILRLPVRVVAAPRASEGELVLDFVEGQVAAVPMPELIFDLLGEGLSSAILLGQDYAQVTEITIGPGTLTVRGRYEG